MGLDVNMCIKKNTIFTRLKGEMDEETTNSLRNKITDLICKYNISNVVFNLSELSFLDSSGIGLIIGRYNQVKDKRGHVVLCGINNNIEKIILLSGLLKICTLRDNEESASFFLGVS